MKTEGSGIESNEKISQYSVYFILNTIMNSITNYTVYHIGYT